MGLSFEASSHEDEDDAYEEQTNEHEDLEEESFEDTFGVKPYMGEHYKEALPELFIQNAVGGHHQQQQELDEDIDDELLWVPQSDLISFKPLCLSVSGGYYTNLLRVKGSGLLSRHIHPGPIHAYVIKGSWKYLEHDWIATEGSYIFEPPGDIHTLVVPRSETGDDTENEMITMFHVTGSVMYCDEYGNVNGDDDVFTKIEMAKQHYNNIGLDGDKYIKQFLR